MSKKYIIRNIVYGYKDRLSRREIISGLGELPFIFVHIPKAAGMSITRSLYGREIGHRTIGYYKAYYGSRLLDKYSFSFVRNPWDRLYSAYTFLLAGGMSKYKSDVAMSLYLNEKYPDFQRFVMCGLNDNVIKSYIHFIPQCVFLTIGGRIAVDFVGRFEDLESDFEKISDQIGRGGELLHENKTKRSSTYKDVYSKEMIDRVERSYLADIKLLGYEF